MIKANFIPNIELRFSEDKVDYDFALAEMEKRALAIRAGEAKELVWFLEHPPLYTAGTSAKMDDLLDANRFPVYDAGRGGEYTYHGPGQRVVYVMLDLTKYGSDIGKYIQKLEQWLIDTLASFQITGERRDDRIGVWVDKGGAQENKIAAIGVRVKKWVSYHGIAINVNPDLSHFGGIVPCGISQFGVTSFEDQGVPVSIEDVDVVLIEKFIKNFQDRD
jgi:lipoyl(octanoyl) transferase